MPATEKDDEVPRTIAARGTKETKVVDLGRYRLIAELARGGMGIVYLALARGPAGFHKLLVVKELKPHLVEDENLLAMFLDEARLAARLAHENIVQTVEVGSEGNRHYIVMEYLEGQTLHQLMSRARKTGTTVPLHLQIRIIAGTLAGLHAAHELIDFDGTPLGVVHRDVSPQNVFVTYAGHVKVVDFGIAKALDSTTETRTGVLKGKVAYLSPEQARGLPVDPRSDIFAVGVMLFQAATGKRLWEGLNDLQIIHRLCDGILPRPRDLAPDLPVELETIIAKAMALDPSNRHASAAELLGEIERFLATIEPPGFRSHDLGRFVLDLFQSDRARIRSLVDQQVKMLKGLATSEIPAITLLQLDAISSGRSGTPSGVFQAGQNDSASRPPSALLTTPPPRAPLEHTLAEAIAPSLAVTAEIPRNRSRSGVWIAAALSFCAIAGIAAYALTSKQSIPNTVAAGKMAEPSSSPNLSSPVTTASSTNEGTPISSASATSPTSLATDIAGSDALTKPSSVGAPLWKKPKTTTIASASTVPAPSAVPIATSVTPVPTALDPKTTTTTGKPKHEIDKNDPYAK